MPLLKKASLDSFQGILTDYLFGASSGNNQLLN